MSDKGIIYWCVLASYCYNRDKYPDTTPKQWESVFGDTTQLEKDYQKESQMLDEEYNNETTND